MRSVILTGAAGGVGKAALKKLVCSGYVVYAGIIDQWEQDEVEQVKSQLNTDNIIPVPLDLREPEQIEAVVSRVESENPELAGLLTNGASAPIGVPFEHLELEFFKEVYNVNVFGNLSLIQRCLPLLKKNKGRIVHTSSVFGKTAAAMMLAYSSSKHSNEAMLMVLRRELKRFGIKVVIVNPGVIWDTYMTVHQYEGSRQLVAEMDGCSAEEISPYQLDQGKCTGIRQPQLVPDTTYRKDYLGIVQALEPGLGPKHKMASSPDQVADYLMNGLTLENPRTRYISGIDSKLLIFLTWLLPEKWADKVSEMVVMGD